MDRQHHYEEPHYGGAADHTLQPAWLCMPQIKVENDIGVYHCQPLPCSDRNLNSSKSSDPDSNCLDRLECTSQYNKNVSLPSQNNYCDDRGLPENARYVSDSNHLSNVQHSSIEVPQLDVCMDRTNTTSPFLPQSDEDQNTDGPLKINKCHSSSWCLRPTEDEDLHGQDNGKHLYSGIHGSRENRDMKNCKTDMSESRQAFDLTSRNKNLSKEESPSGDDPPVTIGEEVTGTQPQARCTPKPQTCKICGKVLSSPSSYYVHMKLHSGNKPYACNMCEASFCRKPYLEVHMRTHTGERPFECDTCNKRFTQKSSLNTHKRVHTGERPYSCDICQKTFAVKSYVTAHRWSHVSERPLGCQRCGLTFTSKNLFSLHIRTHVDQNHECHICGRTFMKDSYLIRHQNRVHRDRSASYPDSNEPRSPALTPPSLSSPCRSIASQ